MGYVLPLLLALLCLVRTARAEDLQPNAPSSHEGFLKLLNESRVRSRQEIIGRYDAYLSAAPNDHLTAIERCKFILNSSDEDGGDEDEPSSKSCSDDLEAQHGRNPAVVLFRLSMMWGTRAIEYGQNKLADRSIRFSASERASVLGTMAERQRTLHHLKEASQLGEEAQRQDSSFDASLPIADYLRSMGQRQAAIQVLGSHIADDHDARHLLDKARMLFELDDPALALTSIRTASAIKGAYVDPAFQGNVLEALGDTDGARAAYAKQQSWNRQEVLPRLFYLDLESKGVAAATASYRALRDLGWRADPVARHRLALSLKHPSAPWMLRDVAGLFGLVGLILFAALLPGCVALPIHYVGLLRRARGAERVPTRWSLRNMWAALGSMFVGEVFALYIFACEELAKMFASHGKANLSQLRLAHVGVASIVFTALVAASFTRRSDWPKLSPTAWMNRATLGTAGKYVLLLLAIGALNRFVVSLFGHADPTNEGIALSTMAGLRAIRSVYGPAVLILFAAVMTPLSEELLFRGVMLDGLSRHIPFRWANGVQACLFALLHDNLKVAPYLFAMAVFAGMLRRRTQSLATGTALHAMNNLLASFAISS